MQVCIQAINLANIKATLTNTHELHFIITVFNLGMLGGECIYRIRAHIVTCTSKPFFNVLTRF